MENQNSIRVIGENPQDIVSNDVQQNYDDTCAIKSQQLVLKDFGINVSEDQLVQQAEQLNLYAPGSGTSPQDVGKLLEINGVHCTQHPDASIYDLTSALAQGEKVIIGVDSGELWNNNMSDTITGEKADHALIVAGIDTTDPNNVQVILTDPGTGQEGAHYPMDQFLDAWHDSGNFMVTTDTPAPAAYNPGMINFDYTTGHIPYIGLMPYDYFNQTILPLSQELITDPSALDMLHHDFTSIVGGELTGFSPELTAALEHTPYGQTQLDIHQTHNYQGENTIQPTHEHYIPAHTPFEQGGEYGTHIPEHGGPHDGGDDGSVDISQHHSTDLLSGHHLF